MPVAARRPARTTAGPAGTSRTREAFAAAAPAAGHHNPLIEGVVTGPHVRRAATTSTWLAAEAGRRATALKPPALTCGSHVPWPPTLICKTWPGVTDIVPDTSPPCPAALAPPAAPNTSNVASVTPLGTGQLCADPV